MNLNITSASPRTLFVNLYKTPDGVRTGHQQFEDEAEAIDCGMEVQWGDYLKTVGVEID